MRRGMGRAIVMGFGVASLLAAGAGAQAEARGEQAAPDVVAAYFAIWNSGSVDGLDDVVTADFRRHAGPGERVESRDELAALIATTRSIYHPFELRIDDHYASGEGGAARGTFHGVHAEVRRVVEFPVMSVFRMRDGRLSEEWILGDNFLALLGLGYQMTPPGFTVTRPGGETTVAERPSFPSAPGAETPAAAEPVAAASAATEAEQVLRRYIDVWNSGRTERLAELTSEDFQRHSNVGAAGSRRELAEVIRRSRGFYPDLHMEIQDVVASGDHGAMRARFVGTYGQTKVVLRAASLHMFELRDGRVTAEWIQGNTTDLWTSFGYRLSPPDATLTPPPIEVPPEPFPAVAWGKAARVVAADGAPEPGRAGTARTGTMRIESPVACRVELDGREVGGLAAGGSAELRIASGRHRVRALSLGGSQLYETTVEVKRRGKATVRIEPPGRVVVRPRDQTAEDLETGLMWQMRDNGSNIALAQARATCEALDQGGHTDWRLPSIYELQSLYREDAEDDGYDTLAGIFLSDCCPWTSTPHGDYHWTYVFHMGMRFLEFEALPWHMRVLCVRDADA